MALSDRGTTRRNWGRWGADDQRGAPNLLTPEVVRSAAASVTRGRVYGLGMPVRAAGVPALPGRAPMRFTVRDGTDAGSHADLGCAPGTGSHEDAVVMSTHAASHMDALVHVYAEHRHYNGVGHDTMRAETGAGRLGIENVGGLATRGVLLDMVRHFGAVEYLQPGHAIGGADLAAAAAAQGVEVRAGDAVLIRTGYLQFLTAGPTEGVPRSTGIPGIDASAAQWLAERDVVAVGADNAAVEVLPFAEGDFLRVHKMLLVDCGIHLLEFLDLSAPAADEAWDGLLTVGPLKITGGTGSPVNPVYVS